MKNKIFVFLGPSLSLNEANSVLEANYLPPSQPGDIHRILDKKPQAILLVDGDIYRGTCRHKEILHALQSGVPVFGAAGLGATRAAELKNFGMQGLGEVYNWYLKRTPQFDANEVMCSYEYSSGVYKRHSESLINLRFKINANSDPHKQNLIERLSQTYYQNRNSKHFVELSDYASVEYDVQKEDTLFALQYLKSQFISSSPPPPIKLSAKTDLETLFFQRERLFAKRRGVNKILMTLADLMRVSAEWAQSKSETNLELNTFFNNIWSSGDRSNDLELYKVALAQALHPMGSHFLKCASGHMNQHEQQNLRAIELAAILWRNLDQKYLLSEIFPSEMLNSQRIEFLQEMALFNSLAFAKWRATNNSGYTIESIMTKLMPLKALLNPTLRLESLLQSKMQFQHINWVEFARLNLNTKIESSMLVEL